MNITIDENLSKWERKYTNPPENIHALDCRELLEHSKNVVRNDIVDTAFKWIKTIPASLDLIDRLDNILEEHLSESDFNEYCEVVDCGILGSQDNRLKEEK